MAGLLLAVSSAGAAEIAGTVELYTEDGRPVASAEAQYGVVYFKPTGASTALVAPGTFSITTRNKAFSPRVLPVPAGSTVQFPNADPILHNVFSVSPGNAFDVGLYGPGEGRSYTFETPGIVRVFCNVHHAMMAYVVVLDTPYFASPDARGAFVLRDAPVGAGRLTVWQERSEAWTRDVVLPLESPLVVRLEVTGRRVPRHLDKTGQPYGDRGRDRYE
jgi:plastocyanin